MMHIEQQPAVSLRLHNLETAEGFAAKQVKRSHKTVAHIAAGGSLRRQTTGDAHLHCLVHRLKHLTVGRAPQPHPQYGTGSHDEPQRTSQTVGIHLQGQRQGHRQIVAGGTGPLAPGEEDTHLGMRERITAHN